MVGWKFFVVAEATLNQRRHRAEDNTAKLLWPAIAKPSFYCPDSASMNEGTGAEAAEDFEPCESGATGQLYFTRYAATSVVKAKVFGNSPESLS
jgi:hypothetical protein